MAGACLDQASPGSQLLRTVLCRHSLGPSSSPSRYSQSVPKVKCLGSSLFPPRRVQSQMQTVHLMNVYGKKRKKIDKKKVLKQRQTHHSVLEGS